MHNPRKTKLTWFLVGVAVGLATMAVAPAQTAVDVDTPSVAAEMPASGEGEGHGTYCKVPERGTYFLGRDFEGTAVRSLSAFVDWCDGKAGALGWRE